jgi:hypothetical protein
MLEPPPSDLATREYTVGIVPPPHGHPKNEKWISPIETFSSTRSKREAFMLCTMITKVNEAATYFKTNYCNGTANFATFDIHLDPDH